MNYRKVSISLTLLTMLLLLIIKIKADEGMYLLDQIDPNMMEKMKKMGLKLSQEEIYNPQGTSLAHAVVSPGATASFVSPNGLILTNHHVAFGAVQRISTPEQNYIEMGYLAKTLEEEIPAPGYQVFVLQSIEDVTGQILSEIREGMSDYDRYMAIEKKTKEIIKKAEEKGGGLECDVSSMNYGMKYYLFTFLKIRDIRVVYIPARAIGEYGGEIDNWMWPRHTGDFSFLRAYVGPDGKPADHSKSNVPYKPKSYLKISARGISEGDFTMIMGFPGRTARHQTSFAVENDQTHRYPFQIQMAGDLIRILEEFAQKDEEAAVKLSGYIKGLYNTLKNNQGMLEGLVKTGLLEKKRAEEMDFLEFLKNHPEMEMKYGQVLPQLETLYREYLKNRQKSSVMGWMGRGLLGNALSINKWSIEREKKDMDREPGYQERDLPDSELWLNVAQKSLVPEADRKVLEYFLKKALALPPDQKIVAVERMLNQNPELSQEQAIAKFLDRIYAGTMLGSAEERVKMLHMKREELLKLHDPFIEFADEMEKEREIQRKKEKAFSGAVSKLMPLYLEGVEAWIKQPLYPDANGTIRFNFGQVKGYSPKDAVSYRYITSLTGVIEKNTGVDPFDCPEKLIDVYKAKDFGSWVDKNINDVPVDFLTSNDSTGGNSGSPVLNGRGELVGILFDGIYESMYSDYHFDPELTRSIHVDIRYVLFCLDKLDKALNILNELTIIR
ncbi:MAG: S46 family peptidase [Acidobacteriota bacterium]